MRPPSRTTDAPVAAMPSHFGLGTFSTRSQKLEAQKLEAQKLKAQKLMASVGPCIDPRIPRARLPHGL